jgi:hypothetical protein
MYTYFAGDTASLNNLLTRYYAYNFSHDANGCRGLGASTPVPYSGDPGFEDYCLRDQLT